MARVQSGRTTTAIVQARWTWLTGTTRSYAGVAGETRTAGWTGRPPAVVPKALMDEWIRRQMSEGVELLQENTEAAVQVIIQVATDPEVDPETKLKAAQMILDRTLGEPKETMDLEVGVREPTAFEEQAFVERTWSCTTRTTLRKPTLVGLRHGQRLMTPVRYSSVCN
ncbi:MAG: hypothetical protein U5K30_14080 [Acidimicrobiales bacterium]|nr:hypothetical protein [Acidimicrobiales bacterium]